MHNQKHVLIPAGRWKIDGFCCRQTRCMCCGRPIRYVLLLKNEDHLEKIKIDPSYSHPEIIDIGRTCGPQVFQESTKGFYEDPEREWNRQYAIFKDFIEYIVLCTRNADIWQTLPIEIRCEVDNYLETGHEKADHTGGWWMLRDAKKRYLRSKRKGNELPVLRILWYNAHSVVYSLKRLNLIPQSWTLTSQMELVKSTTKESANVV